jgi:hypothetical protein
MSKNKDINYYYNNPELFELDNLMQSLMEREYFRICEELWFSILSLRLKLKDYIDKIVFDWNSSEISSNKKFYSFCNIVEWTGYELFRDVFVEFLNYKNYYTRDCLFENSCLVYIRLIYEKSNHEIYNDNRNEFTKIVNDKLGNKNNKILDNYIVNCYLGLVSGSTSSCRYFPRYEVSIFNDKGFPDGIDKIIKDVTEFYFSNVKLSLTKQITNNILKFSYYRTEKITIPQSFLEEINKKIEIIINSTDECYEVLEYEKEKITKEYMCELSYNVAVNYINILKKGDLVEFNRMISSIKRSQICINSEDICPCCRKKDK